MAHDLQVPNKTYRSAFWPAIIGAAAAVLFCVGFFGSFWSGHWGIASFIIAANILIWGGFAFCLRNYGMLLKDGFLIVRGLSGREVRTIPFSDIQWVNVYDSKGVGNDGWSCTVTTRQGPIRFSGMVSDYKELAEILDRIARANPSKTEENLGRVD